MASPHAAEWERLYKRGWSTPKIARRFHASPSTVYRNLNGLVTFRPRIEALVAASTKYPKFPFSGDLREKAFISGFVEDCHVRRQGRQVEVSTTTTHPAFVQLFSRTFRKYGHVACSVGYDDIHHYYRSHLSVYLDQSFGWITKSQRLPAWVPLERGNDLLNSYLSGLIAAEGMIRLYRRGRNSDTVVNITINKRALLQELQEVPGGSIYNHTRAWRLVWYGTRAVGLLRKLSIQHREKASKARLALRFNARPWAVVEGRWNNLVNSIKAEVVEYKQSLRAKYISRHHAPHPLDRRPW